jgi:hypothetical protein
MMTIDAGRLLYLAKMLPPRPRTNAAMTVLVPYGKASRATFWTT